MSARPLVERHHQNTLIQDAVRAQPEGAADSVRQVLTGVVIWELVASLSRLWTNHNSISNDVAPS